MSNLLQDQATKIAWQLQYNGEASELAKTFPATFAHYITAHQLPGMTYTMAPLPTEADQPNPEAQETGCLHLVADETTSPNTLARCLDLGIELAQDCRTSLSVQHKGKTVVAPQDYFHAWFNADKPLALATARQYFQVGLGL